MWHRRHPISAAHSNEGWVRSKISHIHLIHGTNADARSARSAVRLLAVALVVAVAAMVGMRSSGALINLSSSAEVSLHATRRTSSLPLSEEVAREPSEKKWPLLLAEKNIFIPDYRVQNPSQVLLANDLFQTDEALRLNLTMGCAQNSSYGVGNAIARIYTARLLALATGSAFSFHCADLPPSNAVNDICSLPDGNPCLLSKFEIDTKEPESADVIRPIVLPSDVRSLLIACRGRFPHMIPNCLGLISGLMVRDIRRIATDAVNDGGIRPDDVAIHFRCGDILRFDNDESGYGLVPHGYYSDRIPPNVKDISILTQPFKKEHLRPWDVSFERRCEGIVLDFQRYLQERFPGAIVHIRNDPDKGETSFTSFVRLVVARKAAFCGLSSFCTSAVLATEADRGYIYATKQATWAVSVVKNYANVEYIKGGPILPARGKTIEEIVHMLRNSTLGAKKP
eukprot:CAMPEP_0197434404 /NCGR_PEP_ID=MMETSP1175-20131217/2143_1 /TAXON_ID=1003142 /ORGANISM="Triceratium dubium, Strain CCMP147" /LENGTH=453 /DNA_ID=CAMNT_0042963115 /DNA_START=200 /DNA_END=1561 /DNA_ORIENTATION=+